MDLSEKRQEFTIFLLDSHPDRSDELRESLIKIGYEVLSFSNSEILKNKLPEVMPHLVIFNPGSVEGMSVETLIDGAQKVSPEIIFIALVEPGQERKFSHAVRGSLYESIELGPECRRLLMRSVDRAVERLCFIYQNEQLIDRVGRLQADYEAMKIHLFEVRTQNLSFQENIEVLKESPGLNALHQFELQIEKFVDREAMLQNYLDFLGHIGGNQTQIVFFRFLPTVHSFLATHSFGVEYEKLKGVGFRLSPEELRGYKEILRDNRPFPSLEKMIQEGFSVEEPRILPLFVEGELEGLFVFLSEDQDDKLQLTFELARISFTRAYRILRLEKRLAEADARDGITLFLTQLSLLAKISDELTRARRITSPLSFVLLKIDQLKDLENELGDAGRDLWLKSFASILRKASRTNDFIFRLGYDEFALLLPHTPQKGAAILAERLRRMVESTSLVQHSLKITVSCGVSEYPSFCSSPEDLVKTAQLALTQVTHRGGNKVCLSSAASDFKPEFEIGSR